MSHVPKDPPGHVFAPPREARFMMVNGIMEAFRPGTELKVDNLIESAVSETRTPEKAAVQFVTPDLTTLKPAAPPPPPAPKAAPPPPPPPPPKKAPDNLEGLY